METFLRWIQPADSFFFILHKLCFIVSPLNKRLLLENVRRDLPVSRAGSHSVDWLWLLKHPSKVIDLLEHYHMVERKYIYLLLVQLIIYAHFTIKFFIYSSESADRNSSTKVDHFNIFDDLVGSFPNSALLNRLWFVFILNTFSQRLYEVAKMIRLAVVNCDSYKEISICQVNLSGSLVISSINSQELVSLIVASVRQERKMSDFISRTTHFENSARSSALIRNNFHKLSQAAKLYYLNAIDFGEYYKDLPINFKRLKQRYKGWFLPRPRHRFNIQTASFFGFGFAFFIIIFVFCYFFYVCFYTFSLAFNLSQRRATSAGSLFSYADLRVQLTKPLVVVNMIEISLYILIHLPWEMHIVLIIADVACLTSRIQRIIELMENELPTTNYSPLLNQGPGYKVSFELARKTRCELDENFKYYIELVRLVHLEFFDIRAAHTFYLNVLHLSSGLVITYALSLLYMLDYGPEVFLVILNIIVCLMPCIVVLLVCATIERKVSYYFLRIKKQR